MGNVVPLTLLTPSCAAFAGRASFPTAVTDNDLGTPGLR
jgi:hypothetical protein